MKRLALIALSLAALSLPALAADSCGITIQGDVMINPISPGGGGAVDPQLAADVAANKAAIGNAEVFYEGPRLTASHDITVPPGGSATISVRVDEGEVYTATASITNYATAPNELNGAFVAAYPGVTVPFFFSRNASDRLRIDPDGERIEVSGTGANALGFVEVKVAEAVAAVAPAGILGTTTRKSGDAFSSQRIGSVLLSDALIAAGGMCMIEVGGVYSDVFFGAGTGIETVSDFTTALSAIPGATVMTGEAGKPLVLDLSSLGGTMTVGIFCQELGFLTGYGFASNGVYDASIDAVVELHDDRLAEMQGQINDLREIVIALMSQSQNP